LEIGRQIKRSRHGRICAAAPSASTPNVTFATTGPSERCRAASRQAMTLIINSARVSVASLQGEDVGADKRNGPKVGAAAGSRSSQKPSLATIGRTPSEALLVRPNLARPASFIKQRHIFRVWSPRNRLQIGVNICKIIIRENLLAIGRHGAIGRTYKARKRVERKGIRRKFRPSYRALPHGAVALPATHSHEDALTVLCRRSKPARLRDKKARGQRRQADQWATTAHRESLTGVESRRQ